MTKLTVKANAVKMKKFGKGLRFFDEVLNGITWNHDQNYFLLTGKNWPIIFAVKFEDYNIIPV